MNTRIKNLLPLLLGAAAFAGIASVRAQQPDADVEAISALKQGTYISPMAEYAMNVGKSQVKNPLGGVFAVGYRESFYSIEAGYIYTSSDPRSGTGPSANMTGGALNALIFPTTQLPGLYGLIGVGELAIKNYPGNVDSSFSVTNFQGGLGYQQKIRIGSSYMIALRAEADYRYGFRENGQATNEFRADSDAPRQFHDVVFNVGLVLPIDISHWLHPVQAEPVRVVPEVPMPAQPAAPAPVPDQPAPSAEAAPSASPSLETPAPPSNGDH